MLALFAALRDLRLVWTEVERGKIVIPIEKFKIINQLRACLHGGGGPQVGEVTRLAVVEKWPVFTCNLATPGSRGDVTTRCCVVARHVNRENARRTTHFDDQCSFPLIICSRCNISVLWLFTVTFDDTKLPPKAVNCNMNSTPARRVTSTLSRLHGKMRPRLTDRYPIWQTRQPA